MTRRIHVSDHGFRRVILLGTFIALFLLPGLSVWSTDIVWAQAGGLDDAEAQRHLDLGRAYELAGEWDLALEEYGIAAQAESESLAREAREGINRVLAHKNSFWGQVGDEVSAFLVWLTSNSIKLLILAIALLLLGKFVLFLVGRRTSWTVMPFFDLTKNNLGEAVSESIVSLMHEARLVHLNTPAGMLNASEEVDLPSFRTPSCQEALFSSLQAMDSLDVGGIGFPVGSALAAAVRWLDMGRRHILGTIQQREQDLCLSAQLREGRASGSRKVWSVCAPITQAGLGSTLFELERDLAFRILHDTQEGWGPSTPASLRLFTEALLSLQSFQMHPTVQEKALHDTAGLLKKALSVDPGCVAAKYNLAIVYHNLGRHQEAIDTLRSLRLQPDHGLELEIAYSLGAAYYHLLQYWAYDYAEEEFRQVLEKAATRFTTQYRELCALAHCGLTSVYAQKMRDEYRRRNPGAASSEEYFRRASEHYAKALSIASGRPQIVAIAHTAMGMALLNHGRPQEAAAKFKEAVQLKPNHWRAYIHWGRAEKANGDLESAVFCLKQAVALNPGYEFAQYQLGIALKEARRYDEAVESFAHAPGIAQAHDEQGCILAERYQRYEAALARFERALEIKPDLSNAMVNIAWYTLEAGYQDDEHLDRALQCALQAVELEEQPGNLWHRHSVLGRVHLAMDQLDEARRELEKAIQLNKKAPQSYFFLARVHMQLGEMEEARRALAEFLKRPRESAWYARTREIAITLMREVNEQLQASA